MKRFPAWVPLALVLSFLFSVSPAAAYDEENYTYSVEWPFPPGGDFDMARTQRSYSVTDQSARIYVPDDAIADGRPLGLYVHLSFNDTPHNPAGWQAELEDLNLAYCSPHDGGGSQNLFDRFFRVVDCVASMSAEYNIDMERVVLGGYSAGGVSAVDIVVAWQELFAGVISHARTVPWEGEPISTRPGFNFGAELARHDNPTLLAALRERGRRFVFISGEEDIIPMAEGDFSNYEGILKSLHQYWERGLIARVFDVPGMQHRPAAAEPLGLALRYILSCEDGGEYPPRFDMNHRPPHTPVASPSVMAPACIPTTPSGDAGPGPQDAGLDSGATDGGPGFDAGSNLDASPGVDAGPNFDGGPGFDAGGAAKGAEGCGCRLGSAPQERPSWPWLVLAFGLARRTMKRAHHD